MGRPKNEYPTEAISVRLKIPNVKLLEAIAAQRKTNRSRVLRDAAFHEIREALGGDVLVEE